MNRLNFLQGISKILGTTLGHRQVFAHRVPRVLRVLQPHVLDHLPARLRRRG